MSLSRSRIDTQVSTALNGICAYFTMFPLAFPHTILREHAKPGDIVLDPFCGRGTTNYASRLLGLPSIGIDSHPLAVALTQAKLAFTTPTAIVNAARQILDQVPMAADVPTSEFWQSAFHPEVLSQICRLRIGLLRDCRSAARKALRAVLLGALHGPLTKTVPSYFSNQMPRTYAPKPNYAVKYWYNHNLTAPSVDVLRLIQNRAERYYGSATKRVQGWVIEGDSRTATPFSRITNLVQWIITSPPYYGMRTYLPDQWLRLWFLGGPSTVDYSNRNQLRHTSPDYFASELTRVWQQLASVSAPQAQLIVRFGGINDRRADPVSIIKGSFVASGWQIKETHPAGSASSGRRQALHFSSTPAKAIEEIDVWAIRSP
jgi:DNA methylase